MQLEQDGRAEWGDTEHLLAALIDATQLGNYQRARAHFKGEPRPPEPLRRPGPPPKVPGRTELTPEQIAARLQRLRRRRRETR